MSNNPLVSVIIPVYNVSEYLDECLTSVCGQTYKNLEIILVDDGSSDDSGDKCGQWSKRDDRIKVFHKSNGGLSDARNYALERMSGEFVTFVDSDDYIHSRCIEYLYGLVSRTSADIGVCDPAHFYDKEECTFLDETSCRVFSPMNAICEMLYQRSFLVSAWGKLYKRDLFDSVRFPVGMLFEDSAVMYSIIESSNYVTYGNAKYYAYRHRNNSITTQEFSEREYDIWKICKEIYNHYAEISCIHELVDAARAYQASAALRIILNDLNRQSDTYHECISWMDENALFVSKDRKARIKNRVAAILYLISPNLLGKVYKHVDRWK